MISAKIQGEFNDLRPDYTKAMREVAEIAERAIQTNFMMGGRPRAWEPVKPPRSGTPLVATGALYHSIHSDSGRDWAEVYAGGNFADPRIPRALHGRDWGTFTMTGRNHAARLPARPFMVLTEFDIDQIRSVVASNLIITGNTGG